MNKKSMVIFLLCIVFSSFLFVSCSSRETRETNSNESKKTQAQRSKEDSTVSDSEKSTKNTSDNSEASILDNDTPINIVFNDGTPALTFAKMIDERALENINYDKVPSPDALMTKVLNKEADIAIVPSSLAAIAYNKQLGYKIVGTSIWGNLYIISNQEGVSDLNSLKGQTLTLFSKGSTPDSITRYILEKNSIIPDKDITLNYLSSATEIVPAFLSKKANIVLVPEPIATVITSKEVHAKRLMDLNAEAKKWGMPNGYPQATMIVKEDLIEDHKELIDAILQNYQKSIQWAKKNKEPLADMSQRYELGIEKSTVLEGFDALNMGDFKEVEKNAYETYFDILFQYDANSIGGKIPDQDIYYEK